MLRKLILYGDLADKYGKEHTLDVNTFAEAIKAMSVNFKGFLDNFKVGKFNCLRNDEELVPETLSMGYGPGDFHLMAEVIGADKGFIKAIIGVILIVVGVWFQQPYLVGTGISFLLGGVADMLTTVPTMKNMSTWAAPEEANNRPSFLFNGAINLYEQGHPIPIIYGEMLVGSHTVSASMVIKDEI